MKKKTEYKQQIKDHWTKSKADRLLFDMPHLASNGPSWELGKK